MNVSVTGEYGKLIIAELALCAVAEKLGGNLVGSGTLLPDMVRDLDFKFKDATKARKFAALAKSNKAVDSVGVR